MVVVRGKEKPAGKWDLLDRPQIVPRAKVEYKADIFGGELGPYKVAVV